jgi:hypothetical protein
MKLTKSTLMVSMLGLSLLAPACGSDSKPNNTPGGGNSNTGGSSGTGGSGAKGTGGSGAGGSNAGSGGSTGAGGSAPGSGGSESGSGGAGNGGASGDAAVETAPEAGGSNDTSTGTGADLAPGVSPMASFFITSRTGGGDLGGLTGADKICQDLAAAVGLGGKTWRAYLSTDMPKVDAKSRIGNGPWYGIKGTKIADNVEALHTTSNAMGDTPMNMASGANSLTEKGEPVTRHDIITGTNADGTVMANQTCTNWTGVGMARVGHHNRMGGGQMPNSWNSAHTNQGCSPTSIMPGGGDGRFYCFAITP